LLVVGREAEEGGNAEWQLGRDPRLTVQSPAGAERSM